MDKKYAIHLSGAGGAEFHDSLLNQEAVEVTVQALIENDGYSANEINVYELAYVNFTVEIEAKVELAIKEAKEGVS